MRIWSNFIDFHENETQLNHGIIDSNSNNDLNCSIHTQTYPDSDELTKCIISFCCFPLAKHKTANECPNNRLRGVN